MTSTRPQSGSSLRGEVSHGTITGMGGAKYVGEIIKSGGGPGKMHGYGKLSFPNGDTYEGDFKNNKAHGKGTETTPDGSVYTGEWANGMRHGKGTFVSGKLEGDEADAREQITYVGEWHQDKMHGYGEMTSADGNVFKGEWRYNKKHGKGHERWPNNEEYIGMWVDGMAHGKGKHIYANGDVYEGDWYEDMRHGYGKMDYVDRPAFEGQWVQDIPITHKDIPGRNKEHRNVVVSLTWAKMGGAPWWPALCDLQSDSAKVMCYFFGTYDTAEISRKNITLFRGTQHGTYSKNRELHDAIREARDFDEGGILPSSFPLPTEVDRTSLSNLVLNRHEKYISAKNRKTSGKRSPSSGKRSPSQSVKGLLPNKTPDIVVSKSKRKRITAPRNGLESSELSDEMMEAEPLKKRPRKGTASSRV